MNQHAMMSGKIHRATITGVNLDHEGSISIDTKLLQLTNIAVGEQISVYNVSTGARFETYAIPGGKGEIALNGAAARLAMVGDIIIIVSYVSLGENERVNHVPRVVLVDDNNTPITQAVAC